MNEFESLLDDSPLVQQRVAKGRAEGVAEGLAEGEAKGRAEGEAKGLQEALLFAIEFRFPTLLSLAQERAERVKLPEVLKFALRGLKAAQSEEAARLLLETMAT